MPEMLFGDMKSVPLKPQPHFHANIQFQNSEYTFSSLIFYDFFSAP